jgi:V8-like Glu-specific endopeptidase
MFAIALLKKVFKDSLAVAPRPRRGRALLTLEALESRELFSLTPVSPNAGRPFTAIVELQATFPDHRSFVGSGVMVDRYHVLTAGHVVYSYADGGFASQIRATPDLYGNSAPFGVAYMTYERTYSTFMNYNRTHPGMTASGDYDIALITLDRTIGDRTGWMNYGYDNNNAHFAPGAILNTAGYPATGGYDGRYMEFSYGAIAGLSPDGLAINYRQTSITAFAGQSGSPVWRYTAANNSSVVYGIHVGGNGNAASVNFATRITQSIFNDLQRWRAADRTPLYSFSSMAQTNASLSQNFSLSSIYFHSGNAQAAATVSPDIPAGKVVSENGISTRFDVAANGGTFIKTSSMSAPIGTQLISAVLQMAPLNHKLTEQMSDSVPIYDIGLADDAMAEALDVCTL